MIIILYDILGKLYLIDLKIIMTHGTLTIPI